MTTASSVMRAMRRQYEFSQSGYLNLLGTWCQSIALSVKSGATEDYVYFPTSPVRGGMRVERVPAMCVLAIGLRTISRIRNHGGWERIQ